MTDAEKREKETLRRFEVVAFGCHERAHKRLQDFFRREVPGIQTFMFIEYFCRSPVIHPQWKNQLEQRGIKVFFPFVRRIVDENQFLWIPDATRAKNYILTPRTKDMFDDLFGCPEHFLVEVKKRHEAWKLVRLWGENRKTDDEAWIKPFGRKALREYSREIHDQLRPADNTDRLEWGLLAEPWKRSPETAYLVRFPLTTGAVFYGHFIILLPTNVPPEKTDALLQMLTDISETMYVPLLTLLTESILEEDLVEAIKPHKKGPADEGPWTARAEAWFERNKHVPFLAPDAQGATAGEDDTSREKLEGSGDSRSSTREYEKDYERPLHRCWEWRCRLLGTLENTEKDRREFMRRLPLAKYFVASPGLLREMKLVLGANFERPKVTHSLPAALVYGGPGSGKDVMAQLASIFSEYYFSHAVHTINMAAIRPPEITGPLLQGLYLSGPAQRAEDILTRGAGESIEHPPDVATHLEGLFLQAKRLEGRDLGEKGRTTEAGATFILDELNSLDVDLQGVLLRVLEQGEVMPLGGLSKAYVQHLIVGVVNEDPEQITQEGKLRSLLVEKGKLGSLVSSLLYETLRRTRRLRDDLYHRLKRQLYIRVPEIKDRRPDIPMLFYVEVCKEAKRLDEELGVLVELSAYRLLMDPALTWPGNVRQIHAIAEKAVRAARDDTKTDEPATNDLSIRRSHVQKALRQEFGDIFGRGSGETGDD